MERDKELLRQFFDENPEIVNIIKGYSFETPESVKNAYNALDEFIKKNNLSDNRTFNFILSLIKEEIVKNQENNVNENKRSSFYRIKILNSPESILGNIFIGYYNYCNEPDQKDILTSSYAHNLISESSDRVRQSEINSQPDPSKLLKRINY